MDVPPPLESGPRARTRAAILDAAVQVLTDDRQASLGDIAVAANVGRTTVHRYFPERADLVRAVVHHVAGRSRQAIRRAEPHSGPVRDALRRVVEEHMELGPILMYIYDETIHTAEPDLREALQEMERSIEEVLARPDSGLNPVLPRAWVRRAFWGLLYAGWETAQAGEMPRHEIVDTIIATFTDGVYIPEGGS